MFIPAASDFQTRLITCHMASNHTLALQLRLEDPELPNRDHGKGFRCITSLELCML